MTLTSRQWALGARRFFEGPWWALLSALVVAVNVLRGNYATAIGHGIVYVVIFCLYEWLRRTERKMDVMRAEVEAQMKDPR
jgi:hypothetical protein